MAVTVVVYPATQVPLGVVDLTAVGLTPKARLRVLIDGIVVVPEIRPTYGRSITLGVPVDTRLGPRHLVLQQFKNSHWSDIGSADFAVVVPGAPPPPPPPPPPDTTAPVITGLSVASITPNGASVAWQTDEAATGSVDYGTSLAYGGNQASGALSLTHTFTLVGLTPQTLYHYRVRSADAAGNTTTTPDATFTTIATPDTVPPTIVGVVVSAIGQTGATISWNTDEAATAQVEYGLTAGYGQQSALDTNLLLSHSRVLGALSPGTLYHFRVRSTDGAGNTGFSADGTFTTSTATVTEKSTQVIIDAINAASPGSTVTVAAGVYRGPMISLSKALHLDLGANGAIIRGSDVWTGWSGTGPWTSAKSLTSSIDPSSTFFGQPSRYAALPHQVFVDDVRCTQVASSPGSLQFSVNGAGQVVLGTNPAGKKVEVTLRERLIFVTADNVYIHGGDTGHSLSPTQGGAIQVGGYGGSKPNSFHLLDGARVHDAQGACVSQNGGNGLRIADSDIARGGQLGLHLSGDGSWAAGEPATILTLNSNDWQIQRSKMYDCNWGQWSYGWECGGAKALFVDNILFEDCEVWGTPGTVFDNARGIWTDTGTRNLTVRRVRAHHNALGLFFESTRLYLVESCVLYDNDWSPGAGSWGGQIIAASSGQGTIQNNVLARGIDGIRIAGQTRQDDPAHTDQLVTGNSILSPSRYGVGFGPDGGDPLFNGASNNRGTSNSMYATPTQTTNPSMVTGTTVLNSTQAAALMAANGIP